MFEKKLKRISRETVGYVKVRGRNARDADELTMIVSYGYSNLERCDWYISLLRSGDKKYIVPQSLEELKSIRDELKNVLDEISSRPAFRQKGVIRNYYDD